MTKCAASRLMRREYFCSRLDELDRFPVHNAVQSSCSLNTKNACAGEAFERSLRHTALLSRTQPISAAVAMAAEPATPQMRLRSTQRSAYITGITTLQIFHC